MAPFNNPFEALLALQQALNGRLGSEWMESSTTGAGSYPSINVFEKGDDFVAIIELPGVDQNDLELEAMDNAIRISGRKVVNYDEGASIHRRERTWGVFDRTLSLPIEIDRDAIRAEYRDGVLALFIPRTASEKPRSIKIT